MKKILIISLFPLLTGCFGPDLPECNSQDTSKLLEQIFMDSYKKLGIDPKTIAINDIYEEEFSSKAKFRICSAEVFHFGGKPQRITYKVSWKNEDKELFEVYVTENEMSRYFYGQM